MDRVDVAVVGRGAVGLAAALALSAPGRRVCLMGPGAAGSPAGPAIPAAGPAGGPGAGRPGTGSSVAGSSVAGWDPRVFALSPASQALLDKLGAWQRLDPARVAPVYDMRIANLAGRDLPEVHFDAYRSRIPALAWIVENRELLAALQGALAQSPVEVVDATVVALRLPAEAGAGPGGEVLVELADGRSLCTRLLVAADGANSSIRDWSGIPSRIVDHHQTAIVGNFESERPGRDIAWQWFGPDGILAWLPLPAPLPAPGSMPAGVDAATGMDLTEAAGATDAAPYWRGRWSLVWSVPEDRLDDARSRPLVDSIGRITGQRFGRLRQISKDHAFPLRSVLASSVIAPGLVLIGDAAHAVHPMAGQGMNLGFGDVEALARAVGGCPALALPAPRESPGSRPLLRRYERSRAEAVLSMQLGLSALERLFAPPPVAVVPPLASLRDAGWRLVASSGWLRRQMIRHAVS